MSKYEIRTQAKKDALIRAALTLFQERGYSSVSVNEIAAASGVSAPSIYNYFGSKEKLLYKCVRVLMRDTNKTMIELFEGTDSFKERLLQAVKLCAEQPRQLLVEQFSAAALEDKAMLPLLAESTQRIRIELLTAFIDSGRQEGAISPKLPTETIVEFLTAITELQARHVHSNKNHGQGEALNHLMLYGLIGRE